MFKLAIYSTRYFPKKREDSKMVVLPRHMLSSAPFFFFRFISMVNKGKLFDTCIGTSLLIIFELHLNLFSSKVGLIILNPGQIFIAGKHRGLLTLHTECQVSSYQFSSGTHTLLSYSGC